MMTVLKSLQHTGLVELEPVLADYDGQPFSM
jgi:hypothetical protein